MEWRPVQGHNHKDLGPPQYRYREIRGSHYHAFEDNWLSDASEMLDQNLPIAIPILPDQPDFKSFVDFTGQSLTISGMGLIGMPPWEEVLI
jgi:hypothetical protein